VNQPYPTLLLPPPWPVADPGPMRLGVRLPCRRLWARRRRAAAPGAGPGPRCW